MSPFCSPILFFALYLATPQVATDRPASGEASESPVPSYAEAIADWQAYQAENARLRSEFELAPNEEKQALRLEFMQFALQADAKLEALQQAAINEYAAHPNEDESVTRTLAGIMLNHAMTDNDVEALEIGEVLAANDCPQATFDLVASSPRLESSLFAKSLIDEIAKRREELVKDDLPRVKFTTTKGDIVLELFENEAPNTVANFIDLIENGFYTNSEFHRVLEGFVAQGGRGAGTQPEEGAGFTIDCECYREDHREHFTGSLSMAKTPAINSGGTQFFITFFRTTGLDGKHTVFGRVVSGMDVVNRLQKINPEEDTEVKADQILKAEVLRKRDHPYVPVRNQTAATETSEEGSIDK